MLDEGIPERVRPVMTFHFFDIPVQVEPHRFRDGFCARIEVVPIPGCCACFTADGNGVAFVSYHGAEQFSVARAAYPVEVGGELHDRCSAGWPPARVRLAARHGSSRKSADSTGRQVERVKPVEQDQVAIPTLSDRYSRRVGMHDLESFRLRLDHKPLA